MKLFLYRTEKDRRSLRTRSNLVGAVDNHPPAVRCFTCPRFIRVKRSTPESNYMERIYADGSSSERVTSTHRPCCLMPANNCSLAVDQVHTVSSTVSFRSDEVNSDQQSCWERQTSNAGYN